MKTSDASVYMVEEIRAKPNGWHHEAVTREPWFEWLCRELAPFPRRLEMTIRLVVAVVLVTAISMTLQVPEVAVSAYMVFFVTKENRVVTALTGVLLIVGATVAIAASLVLVHWTLEFPALRVIVMSAALFTGMYLSRVFVVGPLGFAIGFVMSAAQSFMDSAPDGESAVRALLWLWVLVVYPIALTVVLNQILLPAHPHIALQQALTRRLDAVIAALQRCVGVGELDAKASAALRDLATRGSVSLLQLLHFAESKDARLAAHHAAQSAIIAASERLLVAAAALEMRKQPAFAEHDMVCAWALIDEITELQAATRDGRDAPKRESPKAAEASFVELRELQEATTALRDSLGGRMNAPSPSPAPLKAKKHLFVADAFTNPAHVHFALKVTLAAMTCYVFYTGVDWSGIHTAFITCCFIALESTGASLRKGWLRLAGCCLGGLLGFVSILHLIPRMETIVSLALLTAAVSALAGWVAAGSERIAYAGLQIALAFYLAIFQGFAPATDLDVIRDRLAGIVLGIVVVSAVFRYVWPERVIEHLRATLATCLRNLARLLAIPHRGQPEESFTKESMHLCADVTGNIDKCVRLAELTMFEDPEASRQRHSMVLVKSVQSLYLAAAGLTSKAACMDWKLLSDEIQLQDEELRKMEARRLETAAGRIQNDGLSDFPNFLSQRTIQNPSMDLPATSRAALLRILLAQTERVRETTEKLAQTLEPGSVFRDREGGPDPAPAL